MKRGTKCHRWCAEERALIEKHYADHTNKQLADMVNALALHPVPVTPEGVQGQIRLMLLTRPRSFWDIPVFMKHRLRKGHHLGREQEPGVPYRTKKDKDGYCWYVLHPVTLKYVRAHRYVWERDNGPIPPGMLVRFVGPKTDLSRLELISRGSLQHITAAVTKNRQPEIRKKQWATRRKRQATRTYLNQTPYQFAQ